ncbi:MAG: LLM class flavin-dependent oxidoreductase, partial [Acidimicrobiia bacterium]
TMVAAMSRRRPQLVAQSTTSLDLVSDGRMVLGLGLGVDSHGEYSAFDEPAEDDRARAKALDSGIDQLKQMLTGEPVPDAGNRVTTVSGVQEPRVPIWIGGTAKYTAAPRRVRRHGVEGLALAGGGTWSPNIVTTALQGGGLSAGEIDLALVGGTHPNPDALAQAGATWCIPEIQPGATASEAKALATTPPN